MKIVDRTTKDEGVSVRYMDVGSVYERLCESRGWWMKTNRGSLVCLNSGVELLSNAATDSFRFKLVNAVLLVED